MDIYSKTMILNLDDIYENEFSLPILTGEVPFEIVEYSNLECKNELEKRLSQNYFLIIQTPNFPKNKVFSTISILDVSDYFTLYRITNYSYSNSIWEFINENEYADGYTYFLIKDLENVYFEMANSSRDRLKIRNLKMNEIIILRLEMNETIQLTWNGDSE